jgi:hypothetical protein
MNVPHPRSFQGYQRGELMDKASRKNDRSTWAIGGTTLIGVGVGFIFLKASPLFFVASILIGIGLGLVITSLISREKK